MEISHSETPEMAGDSLLYGYKIILAATIYDEDVTCGLSCKFNCYDWNPHDFDPFLADLRGLNTLGIFLAIFTREVTFVTSCLLLSISSPFWKKVALKGKNMLPRHILSFLSRPLFRGEPNQF